jgi:hypothetical protein
MGEHEPEPQNNHPGTLLDEFADPKAYCLTYSLLFVRPGSSPNRKSMQRKSTSATKGVSKWIGGGALTKKSGQSKVLCTKELGLAMVKRRGAVREKEVEILARAIVVFESDLET